MNKAYALFSIGFLAWLSYGVYLYWFLFVENWRPMSQSAVFHGMINGFLLLIFFITAIKAVILLIERGK